MSTIALSLHKKGHYITHYQGREELTVSLPGEDWHPTDHETCVKQMVDTLAPHHPIFAGTIRYPRAKDHVPLGNPLEDQPNVFTHFDLGWRALQKVASGETNHFLWTDDWTYALGNELADGGLSQPKAGQYPVWWQSKAYAVACLFSGNEQERQIQHLAGHFGVDIAHIHSMPYIPRLVRQLRERFSQVIPTQASTEFMMDCPFVERSLNLFRSVEEAYHQFMLDLVAQQVAAWTHVSTFQAGAKIYIGGRLAHCPHFMHGMAEAFFAQEVYGVTGVSLPEWYLLAPEGIDPVCQRYR